MAEQAQKIEKIVFANKDRIAQMIIKKCELEFYINQKPIMTINIGNIEFDSGCNQQLMVNWQLFENLKQKLNDMGEKYFDEQIDEKVHLADGKTYNLYEIKCPYINVYFYTDAWLDKAGQYPQERKRIKVGDTYKIRSFPGQKNNLLGFIGLETLALGFADRYHQLIFEKKDAYLSCIKQV